MKEIHISVISKKKLSPLHLKFKYQISLLVFRKKLMHLLKRITIYLQILSKRYDVQEIYMKPAKQIKRILRTTVAINDGKVKVFGSIYPKNENSPKFTSFFKQIKIVAVK